MEITSTSTITMNNMNNMNTNTINSPLQRKRTCGCGGWACGEECQFEGWAFAEPPFDVKKLLTCTDATIISRYIDRLRPTYAYGPDCVPITFLTLPKYFYLYNAERVEQLIYSAYIETRNNKLKLMEEIVALTYYPVDLKECEIPVMKNWVGSKWKEFRKTVDWDGDKKE